MDSNITLQTKQMIDSLKAVCTNFGLGNASSEYKIITGSTGAAHLLQGEPSGG